MQDLNFDYKVLGRKQVEISDNYNRNMWLVTKITYIGNS